MSKDVHNFVRGCEECKAIKSPKYQMHPEMGKAFIVDRPFQHIYVDFLGLYPRTATGMDHLTKFPLIKTMSKATAINVIRYLT